MGERADKDVKTMLGEPRRAVLGMVMPIFVALLIGQINTFVDSVWCSGLGVDALAVISLVFPVYFVILGIGNGIGVGVNVAVSRRIGAGDREGAEKCASQSLLLMVLISVPLIPLLFLIMNPMIDVLGGGDVREQCVEYLVPMFLFCTFTMLNGVISGMLRGEGAARLSTVINVSSAFVNMVLDPIFIFGLDMGLTGASLATSVSSVTAVVLGLAAYRRKWTYLELKRQRPEKSVLGDVLYVGIPQTFELTVMGVMNVVLVMLVVRCGGTDGLAVYGVPFRMITLAMVPANAIAAAMVPVASSALGQNDPERLRKAFVFTERASLLTGLVLAVAIIAFAGPAMYVFSYAGEMSQYHGELVHALRIYAISLPLYGFVYVGSSMLSSLRKSGYALISSFLRNSFLIILFYVATFHDMDWIYWGFTVGEIVGGLFMLALAEIEFRRKYKSMLSGLSAV